MGNKHICLPFASEAQYRRWRERKGGGKILIESMSTTRPSIGSI